jgi:hypothetical protein
MLADSTGSRRREWAVLAALAVLYYAVPWRALGGAATVVGAPVAFLLLVAAPGAALVRIVGLCPRDAFAAIAWCVMLGLGAALAGCFLWALWGAPIDLFRFGFPVVVLALFAAARPREGARVPVDRLRVTPGERRAMWALAVFLVVVAGILWVSGPATHYTADTIDHVAYVQEIARTHDPFPRTAFYKDPGPDGADLRKSLLHSLFGVFAYHLGADVLALLSFFGAVQLVVLCLCVYTVALSMFGRRRVALLSAVFFLFVFDGGIGAKGIRSSFYPNRFGLAPLLMFIAAAADALRQSDRRERRRGYALCAILGFTAAAVHVQYIVFTAFAGAVIIVWKTCAPRATWRVHLRRSLAALSWAGAAIAPYAVYRFATSYQTNELHHQVQGAVFVAGRLFVANPWTVWDWMAWSGLATLVAVVPLWRRRRETAGVGYTVAAMLSVILVVANPFVLPLAFRAISYLTYRLGVTVPHYMVAALLVAAFFDARLRREVFAGDAHRWWRRAATALAVLALAVGVTQAVGNRHILLASSPAEKRIDLVRWRDGLSALAERLPPGSVIASDPITSYYASAFTPDYVLCTLDQHAPPNDRRADRRMAAARDILSPYTSMAEKVDIIAAHGVTHVVVNEDLPRGLVLQYWTLDPDVARAARRAFEARPDVFEEVESTDKMTVFRWTGVRPAESPVATPVVASPPRGARAVGERSGEATVVAARVGAVRVAAGDTLSVDVYWSREAPAHPGNYVVSLRFDQVGLDLPLGGRPFPKLARKLEEKIDGCLYRYRADHIVQRGFFGPDRWPAGAVVADPATVRLPTTLAPGAYTVQARMRSVAALPNTNLRSYFFDDDMYAGVEIGRIEVTAR